MFNVTAPLLDCSKEERRFLISGVSSNDVKTSEIYGRMTYVRRWDPEENPQNGGKYQRMADKSSDDICSGQLSCVIYCDMTAESQTSGTNGRGHCCAKAR
jgi:hypothetical protein